MISNGFEVIPVALCGDTIPNESLKNLVVKYRTMIGHLDDPGSMPPQRTDTILCRVLVTWLYSKIFRLHYIAFEVPPALLAPLSHLGCYKPVFLDFKCCRTQHGVAKLLL